MATKPSLLPRWGEDVAGVVGPNEAEPLSTKKDVGWTPGEEPPAEYFNWLLRIAYKWLAYLKDGLFAADAGSGAPGLQGIGDGAAAGLIGIGGTTGPGVVANAGSVTPARGALELSPQVAPTAPIDGDFWATVSGFFGQIGGAVVQWAERTYVDGKVAAANLAGLVDSTGTLLSQTGTLSTVTVTKNAGSGSYNLAIPGLTANGIITATPASVGAHAIASVSIRVVPASGNATIETSLTTNGLADCGFTFAVWKL